MRPSPKDIAKTTAAPIRPISTRSSPSSSSVISTVSNSPLQNYAASHLDTAMMQSQHPHHSGPPQPRNSKLDHIIQNFYTKAAQVIVQARLGQIDERYTARGQTIRRSSRGLHSKETSKKANKWFNLVTEDLDELKEDLKFWRTQAINPSGEEPPPMKIDIFLDVSKLSQNQILVVVDETLRRNRIDLSSSTTSSNSGAGVERILIESWTLTLNHPIPDYPVDLPNLYKRSIVFFRSLHSYVRLLPAHNLYRRLRKYGNISQLRLGYRMLSVDSAQNDEIGVDTPIVEGDARSPIKIYEFADIMTPLGHFNLNVKYRRNCDFQLDDMERDLSARFIDMDEHYFTPTMAKYQQEQDMQRARSLPTSEAESSKYKATMTGFKGDLPSSVASPGHEEQEPYETAQTRTLADEYSDPREIVQQRQRQASMTSMSSSSPVNRDKLSFTRTGNVEASTSSIGRKASATNVSPFKSPSLSSSPIPGVGSGEYSISQSKYYTSPTANASSSSRSFNYPSGGTGEESASNSSRKVEFSSSFDRYKGSPSRGDIGVTGMSRRLSRNSDHSIVDFYSSGADSDTALEEFMQFVQSKQELKMFSNKGSTSGTPDNASAYDDTIDNSMTGSGMATSSMYKSKKALSRFQALRESHDNLTDSMYASMIGLGMPDGSGKNYGSPSYTGISPTSSSSSQSRYYQPVVPSPLHAEQRVGPMHIPRDMSAPSVSSSHLHRRQFSSGESHIKMPSSPTRSTMAAGNLSSPDRVAYSSYPDDSHHKELRRLASASRVSRSPPERTPTSPKSRDALKSPPRSPPMERPSRPVPSGRMSISVSPPRHITRHVSNRHASSSGASPLIGPRHDLLQNESYSSLNEGAGESSQQGRGIENSSHAVASGGRSGSLLDDDDSLVFKMSELGNESGGAFDSGMYNNTNQYQQGNMYGSKESPRPKLLIGPNTHFAPAGSPKLAATGGEAMSRHASSSSGMATVLEQDEPNTASSNSSSHSANERRGGLDVHMFSGDW